MQAATKKKREAIQGNCNAVNYVTGVKMIKKKQKKLSSVIGIASAFYSIIQCLIDVIVYSVFFNIFYLKINYLFLIFDINILKLSKKY
jgi:hypothetical protein